jgi:hypothetical protein
MLLAAAIANGVEHTGMMRRTRCSLLAVLYWRVLLVAMCMYCLDAVLLLLQV